MKNSQWVAGAIAALMVAGRSHAGCTLSMDELKALIDYQITDVKTIAGWVDEDDGKVGNADDWEGCRYNRKIIFDDGSSVVCKSYRYGSAWGAQEAVLFKRYSAIKLCVDDELIDVRAR